jgi:predicted transcriptional regulator
MNQAAVKQYLKTVPIKDLDVLEQIIAARREKSEIDTAIRRGLADAAAGRVHSAEAVKSRLREKFGLYKKHPACSK